MQSGDVDGRPVLHREAGEVEPPSRDVGDAAAVVALLDLLADAERPGLDLLTAACAVGAVAAGVLHDVGRLPGADITAPPLLLGALTAGVGDATERLADLPEVFCRSR